MKKDTQDEIPEVELGLEKVGVTNVRTLVKTKWRGHSYKFIPRISLTVDLPKKKKGAHMSRLVEAITESIGEESEVTHESLEVLAKSMLVRLSNKHPYLRGEVVLETELVVERETPATGRKTMETHDVVVRVLKENGMYSKKLTVFVVGNTVCPHSMENTGGKPHIQRAIAELSVEADINEKIAFETLIDVCENSFSSPTYTLLKTPDEIEVVEKMHSNPKFVEDVARGILDKAKKIFPKTRIHARVVSHESIHRHDVTAEGNA